MIEESVLDLYAKTTMSRIECKTLIDVIDCFYMSKTKRQSLIDEIKVLNNKGFTFKALSLYVSMRGSLPGNN